MAQVSSTFPYFTVEEYLEMDVDPAVRYEYVGGQLYALSGGSDRHNEIIMNISGHLWTAARGTGRRVFSSGMRLRLSESAYYYPDAMVVRITDDRDHQFRTRPCLVVEVLSPSTASIDRREKLFAYRQIPSLEAYVMVYQDERRVERHYRDVGGSWANGEVYGQGVVPVPCPAMELTLDDIYEGVDFSSPVSQ